LSQTLKKRINLNKESEINLIPLSPSAFLCFFLYFYLKMLGNELKIKREKELVEKGKFYNPFQHENEREIRNRRKVEASKEEKTLNRQFLNSMKDDINFNDQKRNEEVRK
jgi:hypothetical protein